MRISRLVFGKYLGCAFLAMGTLYGQTNFVLNGDFTQGVDDLDHWTNSDPIRVTVSLFSSGCESGHPCGFLGDSSSPGVVTLSQTITGLVQDATYDFGFYLKSDGSTTNSFIASIGGESLVSLSNFSNSSCSQQSAPYKANSTSAVLSFASNPGLDAQNLILSNVSLFFKSGPSPSPSPIPEPSFSQSAASAANTANGLTVNTGFTTVVNTTAVGSYISNAALSVGMDAADGAINTGNTEGVVINAIDAANEAANAVNVSGETLDAADGSINAADTTSSATNTTSASSNTGYDAANAAAPQDAADAATAATQATDAADAATKAAQNALESVAALTASVNALVVNLKAQIANLTAAVLKIKQKVKAENAEVQFLQNQVAFSANNFLVLASGIMSGSTTKQQLEIDKANLENILSSLKTLKVKLDSAAAKSLENEQKARAQYNEIIQKEQSSHQALSFVDDALHQTDLALVAANTIPSDMSRESCINPKYAYFMEANSFGMAWIKLNQAIAQVNVMEEEIEATIGQIDEILPQLHLSQDLSAEGIDPTRQISKEAESNPTAGKNVHVWGRTIGQYMHQSKSSTSSAFSSGTGGALIGADWEVSKHALGFAGTYMYTYLGQLHNAGHTNVNQGGLSPYGVFNVADWKFDASLYGGYSYNDSHRNGSTGTSKYHAHSNSHAWQLAPHLQITYRGLVKGKWYTADPYVMGDYAANWQSKSSEKGAPGFNAKQPSAFSGFIRTEAGFTFNETIRINYGQLVLREKAGWAYQRALSSSSSTVSIIGVVGAFAAPNNAFIQNLGVAEFAMTFVPQNQSLPTVEVAYEGQFGSKFTSQIGSVNLSKNF